jgi:hypothetical protein
VYCHCHLDLWTGTTLEKVGRIAAGHGLKQVLIHFAVMGLDALTDNTAQAAAEGGHVQIVRYLAGEHNLTPQLWYPAARNGSVELLEHLLTQDAAIPAKAAVHAGQAGHLDALRWLLAH